jgi:DNA recombination protein RmuC
MTLSSNEWAGLFAISLVLYLLLFVFQRFKINKLNVQILNQMFEAKNAQHEAELHVNELNVLLSERDFQHEKQLAHFDAQKKMLEKEFEVLANRIFEDKGKTFAQTSQTSLENLLKPFREQISDFRQRVDGIQKENHESSGSLRKELEHLRQLNQEMTNDAKNLTNALKGDKKKVGGWGEVQLEKTLQLAGLVKGDHYESQAHYKNEEGKNNFPDFVVNLPDNKHIVIDSKVSLVAYDSAVSATSDELVKLALDSHVGAVKNHIDGLASKDYSNLIGMHSPSFVLMFMPIEPAYIEAMKHNDNIYDYAYQKGVILVSHTTLMPILRTVSNLWMVERSNVEAKEISERAGDVYQQVCVLADRLLKLGGTLQTASKQYNSAVVALSGQQGLHGKVERFSKISNKITKTMPKLEPIHTDVDLARLDALSAVEKSEI